MGCLPSTAVPPRNSTARDVDESIGVTLEVLTELRAQAENLEKHHGPRRRDGTRREEGHPLTTADVILEIILPATQDTQSSYAALLPPKQTGRASAFVSHAWSYHFVDLVDAIAAANLTGAFFWLDITVLNQHAENKNDSQWLRTTFTDRVSSIGRTLLVLAPWRAPIALSRAWCLLEVFVTVDTKSELKIQMPPREIDAFTDAIVNDFESIAADLSKLSLAKADARDKSDLEAIQGLVEDGIGMATLDAEVLQAMRVWLADQGRQVLAARPDDLELKNGLAQLLQVQGELTEAARLRSTSSSSA